MSGIDELSIMLGKIQSDILHIKRSTDATETKVDKTHDDMIVANSSLKSAHKRIDEVKRELKEDVTPHITEFKNDKQQGIGRASVLAIVFGFIGSMVMMFARGFF